MSEEVVYVPPKPIVLLDVDGVICNLVDYFLNWVNWEYKKEFEERDVTSIDMTKALGLPVEVEQDFFSDFEQCAEQHCLNMGLYYGAKQFIESLQSRYDVRACTTIAGAEWAGQRAKWLQNDAGIPWQQHVLLGRAVPKAQVFGDLIIEDSLSTVNASPYPAILMNRPWNQGECKWPRVYSYEQALMMVDPLLQEYQEHAEKVLAHFEKLLQNVAQ